MGNLPQEQNASVKSGDGHDAKAPVKKIPVTQEADLQDGQILVKINWTGMIEPSTFAAGADTSTI